MFVVPESEYSPWKSKNRGGDVGRKGGNGSVSGSMTRPSSTILNLLPPVMEVEEDTPLPDTLLRLGDTWPSWLGKDSAQDGTVEGWPPTAHWHAALSGPAGDSCSDLGYVLEKKVVEEEEWLLQYS